MAAGHAKTQVYPFAAYAQTVFTSFGARRDFFDLIEVCAGYIQPPDSEFTVTRSFSISHFPFFISHLGQVLRVPTLVGSFRSKHPTEVGILNAASSS